MYEWKLWIETETRTLKGGIKLNNMATIFFLNCRAVSNDGNDDTSGGEKN